MFSAYKVNGSNAMVVGVTKDLYKLKPFPHTKEEILNAVSNLDFCKGQVNVFCDPVEVMKALSHIAGDFISVPILVTQDGVTVNHLIRLYTKAAQNVAQRHNALLVVRDSSEVPRFDLHTQALQHKIRQFNADFEAGHLTIAQYKVKVTAEGSAVKNFIEPVDLKAVITELTNAEVLDLRNNISGEKLSFKMSEPFVRLFSTFILKQYKDYLKSRKLGQMSTKKHLENITTEFNNEISQIKKQASASELIDEISMTEAVSTMETGNKRKYSITLKEAVRQVKETKRKRRGRRRKRRPESIDVITQMCAGINALKLEELRSVPLLSIGALCLLHKLTVMGNSMPKTLTGLAKVFNSQCKFAYLPAISEVFSQALDGKPIKHQTRKVEFRKLFPLYDYGNKFPYKYPQKERQASVSSENSGADFIYTDEDDAGDDEVDAANGSDVTNYNPVANMDQSTTENAFARSSVDSEETNYYKTLDGEEILWNNPEEEEYSFEPDCQYVPHLFSEPRYQHHEVPECAQACLNTAFQAMMQCQSFKAAASPLETLTCVNNIMNWLMDYQQAAGYDDPDNPHLLDFMTIQKTIVSFMSMTRQITAKDVVYLLGQNCHLYSDLHLPEHFQRVIQSIFLYG